MNQTLRHVKLHGKLAKFHKAPIRLQFNTPAEAVRALCAMLPGFEQELREGYYRLVRGEQIQDTSDIEESRFHLSMGKHHKLHIVPVPAAAKSGGFGKAILGVALIGISFALPGLGAAAAGTTFGVSAGEAALLTAAGAAVPLGATGAAIASGIGYLGTSMLIGGISQILSPQVKNNYQTGQVDQRASFLFDGAINVADQGGPIPIVYGQFRVGSVVVASGLDVENL